MNTTSGTEQVRAQYLDYPFPYRPPERERERLVRTSLDALARIDHHCFGGQRDFRHPLRILVAGGGTGDATIYLAEQLREGPSEIVHFDLSDASIDVARRRAAERGLTGIRFVQGSLLELDRFDLGVFDYINCAGVLHHLTDPPAGLAQLRHHLAPGGGMGLMLYGAYGRRALYQIQVALRGLIGTDAPWPERVAEARRILKDLDDGGVIHLGPTQRRLYLGPEGDTYLADTFLHPVDRAYTAREIYELAKRVGLYVAGFVNFFEARGRTCALNYRPQVFLQNPELRQRAAALPAPVGSEVAEALGGAVEMHAFYVTDRPDTAPPVTATEMVPYFWDTYGQSIAAAAPDAPAGAIPLHLKGGVTRRLPLNEVSRKALRSINGERSTREICLEVARTTSVDVQSVVATVLRLWQRLMDLGLLQLRGADLPPHRPVPCERRFEGAIDLRPTRSS